MSLLDILEFEAPLSRVEEILQNILGASNEVDPESRVEKLLKNLIEVAYEVDPDSRVELLLDNLLGGHNEVVPMSRVEMLIANALGESYDVVPQSRVEELLVLLAEQYAVEYKTVSGSVVSISDALEAPMQSLVVGINPVQDLHGYDSPWPAGGGANKANLETATVRNDGTYGMSVTIDKTAETITMSGTWTGSVASSWRFLNTPDIDTSLSIKAFELTSGSRISSVTQDGAENRLIIQLNNMVSGTAYTISFKLFAYSGTAPTSWTPYSNICPITGWTGANVRRTGKNLFKLPTREEISDAQTVASYKSIPLKLKPNTTYYLSTTFLNDYNANGKGMFGLISSSPTKNDPWKAFAHSTKTGGKEDGTLTTGDSGYLYLRFNAANEQRLSDLSANSQIQLEEGSTATEYEPYVGNTYPISWQTEAGTVYGGTLDVVSGELVVDRASVDLGSCSWAMYNVVQGTLFRYNLRTMKPISSSSEVIHAICSNYPSVSASNRANYTLSSTIANNIYTNVDIIDSTYSSSSDFKTAMNGVQLCYELATPQTYHLTPTEVRTLLGQNNVWADTGDVEVTYLAKKH